MCPVIRISDHLYKRLEARAVGFATPSEVIAQLLDETAGQFIEEPATFISNDSSKPQLIFFPENSKKFKSQLIENKEAEIALTKSDGTMEVFTWKASRFKESSNLKANLWSGHLRDWKKKGITKAEISLYPRAQNMDHRQEIEATKALANYLNIQFSDMESLCIDIQANTGSSGEMSYNCYFHVPDDAPEDLLEKKGWSVGECIELDLNWTDI